MGEIVTYGTHADCGGTWQPLDISGGRVFALSCDRCGKGQEAPLLNGFPVISAVAIGVPRTRPGWTEYFLGIADAVALRADCSRRQVGAVLVRDNRVMATGYNGSASGGPSCLNGQCPRGTQSREELPGYADKEPSSYDLGPGACIALHAEQNAILYSSMEDRYGGTLYVTCEPCPGCWRMLQGSGLFFVVYRDSEGTVVRKSRNRSGEFQ